MARFTFEGDLTNVRQPQFDYFSEVLQKRGFKGSKVLVEAVGTVGDNYIADMKRIVVNDNGGTFKMIAKLAPDNQILREKVSIVSCFRNEEFAYTQVFPKLKQQLKMAGVPDSEGIRFPECYGVSMVAPNEVILLEDMTSTGYGTLNRHEPISDETLKLMLKFLAIYHSLSFALRYKEPEIFAALQNGFEQIIRPESTQNEDVQLFVQDIVKQAQEIIENDKHNKIMKSIERFTIAMDSKIRKIVKGSKHSVIIHGDVWITNVMFKCENGVPAECLMIDYQMIRESNPVIDIMFMIFNSTTHKQRTSSFHNYIDYYHSELEKSLSNFSLKANFVYPRDQLDADLKMYAKFVFINNVLTTYLGTKSQEEAQKLNETIKMTDQVTDKEQLMEMVMKRDEKSLGMFKARLEDLLDSYCEFGLL